MSDVQQNMLSTKQIYLQIIYKFGEKWYSIINYRNVLEIQIPLQIHQEGVMDFTISSC